MRPAYRIVTAVVEGQAVGSAVLLLLLSIVMDIYDASELLRNTTALRAYNSKALISHIHRIDIPPHTHTNHNLFEEKGEPKRYRTEVLRLTSLPPYR